MMTNKHLQAPMFDVIKLCLIAGFIMYSIPVFLIINIFGAESELWRIALFANQCIGIVTVMVKVKITNLSSLSRHWGYIKLMIFWPFLLDIGSESGKRQ